MQNKKEQRLHFLEMISQWRQSGLTQKVFCETNNIRYHIFHYWYKIYRSEQSATSSFLPVNIKPVPRQEQITITSPNGIQVQFPLTDQAVRFIKQLLLSDHATS